MTLAEDLQAVSLDIRERQQALRRIEQHRNLLIGRALKDGWTHAQIAHATGLSRGRIGQLADRH